MSNDKPPFVEPPPAVEPARKVKHTWLPTTQELRYLIPPVGGLNPHDKNRF